ncbi:hypothetical protein KGA34_002682 [Enterococcus faecalis]|uniref:hypothetical protein n=1 Tax=Enterococcus faecalis TaxID=1351 RepID=UPI001300D6BF|nr:hypothetical protein [Enterococcus faecalis]EGO2511000.1 hypothetical protein [Enterococcus faecalis]EHM3140306.1 hypothetical protein [Enterococcus faecalis]
MDFGLNFDGEEKRVNVLVYCKETDSNEISSFFDDNQEYEVEIVYDLNDYVCDNKKYYLVLSDTSIDVNLENFISRNSDLNISYLLGHNRDELLILLSKCDSKKELKGSKDVYLNMIDPKVQDYNSEVFSIINRKNNPLTKLKNFKEITSLSMILHGNGEILYFGKEKLISKGLTKTYNSDSFLNFLNIHNIQSVFLGSCFGLTFTNNALYHDIVASNILEAILYRGLKDNYFPECMWYIVLKKFGYSLSQLTRIINNNIKERSTDLPRYVAIGNPLNSSLREDVFLKFEIREGYIETNEEEIAESRFGYIEGHREFEKLSKCLFVSNVRITWVLDSISERILFFSETKVLPKKIYFVNKQKFFDINNYQMVEEIIELKGSINNKEKNALNDLRNQYSSLEKSLNYANFFSDETKKIITKINKIKEKEMSLLFSFLDNIVKSKQNALSPLSETYIDSFKLVDVNNGSECPYCGYNILEKHVKRHLGQMNRKQEYCANCGQITDITDPNIIKVTILSEECLKEEKLLIKVKMENISEPGLIAISLLYDEEMDSPIMIQPNDKMEAFHQYEYELSKVSLINSIKVYCIFNNKLNIYSKPFRKEI